MLPSAREDVVLFSQGFFPGVVMHLFAAGVAGPRSDFVKPRGQTISFVCCGLGDQRLTAESASLVEASSEAEERCIPVPAAEVH